jgi:hypothetical protein
VPKIRLKRASIMALGSQREPAGVPEHVWMCLEAQPRLLARRSTMRAKPAVVNGEPRSEVNTKGDFGSCSRCSRRSERNSSPRIGCVPGLPLCVPKTLSELMT